MLSIRHRQYYSQPGGTTPRHTPDAGTSAGAINAAHVAGHGMGGPLGVSAADFSHAGELIARAKKTTGSWLDTGGPNLPVPQRFLSMHDHERPSGIADRPDLDRGQRTANGFVAHC